MRAFTHGKDESGLLRNRLCRETDTCLPTSEGEEAVSAGSVPVGTFQWVRASFTSFRNAPGIEPIGIKSGRRPPDLDQPGHSLRLLLGPASRMPENPFKLVGILNDRDHIRVVPQA